MEGIFLSWMMRFISTVKELSSNSCGSERCQMNFTSCFMLPDAFRTLEVCKGEGTCSKDGYMCGGITDVEVTVTLWN